MASSFLPRSLRWHYYIRRYGGAEAARRLGISVGDDCRIYSCNVADEPWLVSVGNRTTVSSEVLFITHDGTGWLFRSRGAERPFLYAPISIGSDCFIGARATILPGVSIGDRCIVAAGTVVHRSVPDGTVIGGNPARVIGDYNEYRARVMREWKWTCDMRGQTKRQRIDSILQKAPRSQMRAETDSRK